jgi:hypothetical protein
MDRLGWFGTPDQLLHFLRTVNADRDEDGQFLVAGEEGPMVGLGGLDVVVPASTVYFTGGQAHGLASGLQGTSYGMGIVVI